MRASLGRAVVSPPKPRMRLLTFFMKAINVTILFCFLEAPSHHAQPSPQQRAIQSHTAAPHQSTLDALHVKMQGVQPFTWVLSLLLTSSFDLT